MSTSRAFTVPLYTRMLVSWGDLEPVSHEYWGTVVHRGVGTTKPGSPMMPVAAQQHNRHGQEAFRVLKEPHPAQSTDLFLCRTLNRGATGVSGDDGLSVLWHSFIDSPQWLLQAQWAHAASMPWSPATSGHQFPMLGGPRWLPKCTRKGRNLQ